MKFLLRAIILSLLIPASFAFAQSAADVAGTVNDVITSGISLTVSPETPGPAANATANLEATTLDLSLSTVTWSVNGKVVKSGRDVTEITFVTGAVGTKTTVSVKIVAPEGTFTSDVVLNTGSVDLLWKGTGYTPPFYEGRTLWGYQTSVVIFAIPHVTGSLANLVYKWSVNGEVLEASSGVGKSSLTVSDSILSLTKTVRVDVMSDRDTVLATGSIDLASIAPFARVYESNPILGYEFHKESDDSYLLSDKEVTFSAFPFFFGVTDRSSPRLSFAWSTNSGEDQHTDTVTYRAPASGSGSASVGLRVENTAQTLQTATKDFLVQFSNGTSQ